MKKLGVALMCAALVCVCGGAVAGKAGASGSRIAWSSCYSQIGPFQCGNLQVPLDYDQPNGPTISLGVVRLPATDQAHRIGSLFLNPGGPGGSGIVYTVLDGPFLYTDEVRARFDLVGFDPRGVTSSTPLRCFGTDRQWGPFFLPISFPRNAEEEQMWMDADLFVDSACAQRGGRIADHMATADVARDMDMLRQAVGDSQLNYAGVSYGTMLGQTYANMFPNRIRAMIIDGVLDPIAWTTGSSDGSTVPFSTRLHSDAGAQATLNEFFRLCDIGVDCAFAPDSEARFTALGEALKAHPLPIIFPDGSTGEVNYSNLIGMTLGAMFDSSSWEDFAHVLADLEAQVGAQQLGARLAAVLAPRERVHHEARLPALLQRPGELPRRRLRGLGQPAHVRGVVGSSGRRGGAVRNLRPDLDVGLVDLRRVAERRRRPLHRAVEPQHEQPGADHRQPVRPRDPVRGSRDRGESPAELASPDGSRLGTHVAVHLAVRRRGADALPRRPDAPGSRDGLRAGPRALQRAVDIVCGAGPTIPRPAPQLLISAP